MAMKKVLSNMPQLIRESIQSDIYEQLVANKAQKSIFSFIKNKYDTLKEEELDVIPELIVSVLETQLTSELKEARYTFYPYERDEEEEKEPKRKSKAKQKPKQTQGTMRKRDAKALAKRLPKQVKTESEYSAESESPSQTETEHDDIELEEADFPDISETIGGLNTPPRVSRGRTRGSSQRRGQQKNRSEGEREPSPSMQLTPREKEEIRRLSRNFTVTPRKALTAIEKSGKFPNFQFQQRKMYEFLRNSRKTSKVESGAGLEGKLSNCVPIVDTLTYALQGLPNAMVSVLLDEKATWIKDPKSFWHNFPIIDYNDMGLDRDMYCSLFSQTFEDITVMENAFDKPYKVKVFLHLLKAVQGSLPLMSKIQKKFWYGFFTPSVSQEVAKTTPMETTITLCQFCILCKNLLPCTYLEPTFFLYAFHQLTINGKSIFVDSLVEFLSQNVSFVSYDILKNLTKTPQVQTDFVQFCEWLVETKIDCRGTTYHDLYKGIRSYKDLGEIPKLQFKPDTPFNDCLLGFQYLKSSHREKWNELQGSAIQSWQQLLKMGMTQSELPPQFHDYVKRKVTGRDQDKKNLTNITLQQTDIGKKLLSNLAGQRQKYKIYDYQVAVLNYILHEDLNAVHTIVCKVPTGHGKSVLIHALQAYLTTETNIVVAFPNQFLKHQAIKSSLSIAETNSWDLDEESIDKTLRLLTYKELLASNFHKTGKQWTLIIDEADCFLFDIVLEQHASSVLGQAFDPDYLFPISPRAYLAHFGKVFLFSGDFSSSMRLILAGIPNHVFFKFPVVDTKSKEQKSQFSLDSQIKGSLDKDYQKVCEFACTGPVIFICEKPQEARKFLQTIIVSIDRPIQMVLFEDFDNVNQVPALAKKFIDLTSLVNVIAIVDQSAGRGVDFTFSPSAAETVVVIDTMLKSITQLRQFLGRGSRTAYEATNGFLFYSQPAWTEVKASLASGQATLTGLGICRALDKLEKFYRRVPQLKRSQKIKMEDLLHVLWCELGNRDAEKVEATVQTLLVLQQRFI